MRINCAKGFTLIELLIVIVILGVLAAGVVIAIDPLAKINSAKLVVAETFSSTLRNSLSFDLVGEWTFDDSTSRDTSGYNNNGSACVNLVSDRKGQTSKACSFDGFSSVITVPNFGTQIPSSEITIAAWIKPGVASGNDDLIGTDPFEPGGGSNRMNVHFPWDSNIHWQFGKPIQGASVALSPSWVGIWGHYVFTASISGNFARIYRNGVQIAAAGFTNAYDPATQATLRIGGRACCSFQGAIDDVRIYTSALLSSQIKQLYAQGLIKHLLADSLHSF